MLNQKTSQDSHNVTSSLVSVVGHTHSALQEYPTISRAGQEAHHVSHSAPQENNSDSLMRDISGQPLCASLTSASLQSSLANKLRQRLENTGSTIYSLSWKDKVTPAGRQYCQRAASVPRIKETDYSSGQSWWYTPTTNTNMQPATKRGLQTLTGQACHLINWPTPTANDHKGSGPTVIRKDGKDRTFDRLDYAVEQGMKSDPWPTPTTIENPQVRGEGKAIGTKRGTTLGGAVRMVSGQILTGSHARMENSGQLSPHLSRWLMGFPIAWDVAAILALEENQKCLSCQKELVQKRFSSGVLESPSMLKRRKYCDQKCMAKGQEGLRVLTPKNSRRQSAKASTRVCMKCQKTEGKMHVHHKDENPLNNDQLNLMTLCVSCHSKAHSPNYNSETMTRKPCVHCEMPAQKNGLCNTHLSRLNRHGHPLAKKIK